MLLFRGVLNKQTVIIVVDTGLMTILPSTMAINLSGDEVRNNDIVAFQFLA